MAGDNRGGNLQIMLLPEGQFLIRTCLVPQFSLQMAAVFPAGNAKQKKARLYMQTYTCTCTQRLPGPLLYQAHSRKCKLAQPQCFATLTLTWNPCVLLLPVSPAILAGSSDVCAIVIQPTIARTRFHAHSRSRTLPSGACTSTMRGKRSVRIPWCSCPGIGIGGGDGELRPLRGGGRCGD